MKRLVLIAMLLLLPVTSVAAQEIPMPMPNLEPKQMAVMSALIKPTTKAVFSRPRSGFLLFAFAVNPMLADGFKKEYGLTDEQAEAIKNGVPATMQQVMESGDNPFLTLQQRITAENMESFALTPEEEEQIGKQMVAMFDAIDTAALAHVTDEQRAKLEELTFVSFGGIDSPFMDLEQYDLLRLTDDQKGKLREMEKETADGRDAIFEEIAVMTKKMFKDKKFNLKDAQKMNELLQDYLLKRKPRIAEILTEEQLTRARDLMKKPPKFLSKFDPAGFQKWIPGLDSWKPGDPVPEKETTAPKKRVFPGMSAPAVEKAE